MFTGIVQALGRTVSRADARLRVEWPSAPEPISEGESIAVNGVCLTVVRIEDAELTFDVSPETFRRSSLGILKQGSAVNLERAATVGSLLGGHIVQGHVDATGQVDSISDEGDFTVFRLIAPPAYDRYLIDKGSVAVDGISLTVVTPVEGKFDVWVVPHTLNNTNLHTLRRRSPVNLEFDVLARYVEKLLGARAPAT